MAQTTNSLEEYKKKLLEEMTASEVESIISKLEVTPHKPVNKNSKRILPGATIKSNNDTFILKSSVTGYYISETNIKYRRNTCKVVKHNTGLVLQ